MGSSTLRPSSFSIPPSPSGEGGHRPARRTPVRRTRLRQAGGFVRRGDGAITTKLVVDSLLRFLSHSAKMEL